MSELIDKIKDVLGTGNFMGRIGGGFVPLPEGKFARGTSQGSNILIINCEYHRLLEQESAEFVINFSRSNTEFILRQLPFDDLSDTATITVRFGYYDGVRLTETVYLTTLITSDLKKLQSSVVFKYWENNDHPLYPLEDSTIKAIQAVLKTGRRT